MHQQTERVVKAEEKDRERPHLILDLCGPLHAYTCAVHLTASAMSFIIEK